MAAIRSKSNRGEALESFQEIFADARWTAPIKLSVAQATVYMRDSEGRCFVASAPMAICMIEASNAFLSLLPALLAHDRLDMTSNVATYRTYLLISTSACVQQGSKQVDGSRARNRMHTDIMYVMQRASSQSVRTPRAVYTRRCMAWHVMSAAWSRPALRTWPSRWTRAASLAAAARSRATTAALVHACLNTTLAL